MSRAVVVDDCLLSGRRAEKIFGGPGSWAAIGFSSACRVIECQR